MSSRNSYKLDQVGIRMVKEPPLYSSEPVNSPEAAVRIIADTLRNYDREVFCVVNLRNDLKPINVNVQSQTASESSSEVQSTDEETDMQKLGSEQCL